MKNLWFQFSQPVSLPGDTSKFHDVQQSQVQVNLLPLGTETLLDAPSEPYPRQDLRESESRTVEVLIAIYTEPITIY